ncbi:gas vesicle protein K [Streptomyces antimicrobicus]|uniref:Gas vesicle protein K n=1 Tax=Streptomyces antimicrobicus TaxID=2883108 RepID=A0ABS8B3P2_9ACTN|nr:gas vesicle protein K [Streptomyces antimicrobicus]MCB5179199.1 gas vesicle protein K [Streptomyces antimicrobicus]
MSRSTPPGPPPDPVARGPDLRGVGDALAEALRVLPAAPSDAPAGDRSRAPSPARRIRTGPDTAPDDLVKLVLTVVELLRQLVERQALRRVDAGDLSEAQEEELGATLLALHDRMTELCAQHGLTLADLNLDLGPLGPLLPPP